MTRTKKAEATAKSLSRAHREDVAQRVTKAGTLVERAQDAVDEALVVLGGAPMTAVKVLDSPMSAVQSLRGAAELAVERLARASKIVEPCDAGEPEAA